MQKIPTNSRTRKSTTAAPHELLLDFDGAHIDKQASAPDRLYQALRHAVTTGMAKPGEALPPSRHLAEQTGFRRNAVTEAYERLTAHLAANQLDLEKTPVTLGAMLAVDGTAERFTGKNAAAANALLTRAYRKDYAVPQLA